MQTEISKVRAKCKLWIGFFICLCGIGMGCWGEYQSWIRPLGSAVFIYVPARYVSSAIVPLASDTVNQVMLKQHHTEENVPVEIASPEEQLAEVKETNHDAAVLDTAPVTDPKNLNDFLDYLQTLRQQAEDVVLVPSALEQIKQIEPKLPEPQKSVPIFEDGKIEIYDSEKGVIGVIDDHSAEQKNSVTQSEETEALQSSSKKADEEVALKKELAEVVESQFQAEQSAERLVRERVQEDIYQVETSGDEAPIVLIPGLQNVMDK
ncbi:MAG: hypothetical protein IJ864_00220 [Alphaproteobacteria bacterium]|nr:hypothetical protein [Alphaproteobacteria bacterium]